MEDRKVIRVGSRESRLTEEEVLGCREAGVPVNAADKKEQ